MNIALLFEQSGTFKRVLQSKGHNAKDFDICNDYNQTDYIIDLFDYIDNTNMERINKADLVIAFYPCTWFSNQNDLLYSKHFYGFKTWDDEKINKYLDERLAMEKEMETRLLTLINKIKVPMIIENPNSRRICKILKDYKSVLHKRSKYGDYFDKPTRYYLFNGVEIEPLDEIKNDIHMRVKYTSEAKSIQGTRKMKRSMMSPLYVENLINHITVKGEYLGNSYNEY